MKTILQIAEEEVLHVYPLWAHGVPQDVLERFTARIRAEQKGERAVICKNCGALYWEEVSQCDYQVGVETQWEEVKVIRNSKE